MPERFGEPELTDDDEPWAILERVREMAADERAIVFDEAIVVEAGAAKARDIRRGTKAKGLKPPKRPRIRSRWNVGYVVHPQDGYPTVVAMIVAPRADKAVPRGGVTTRLLRAIPLSTHLLRARSIWAEKFAEQVQRLGYTRVADRRNAGAPYKRRPAKFWARLAVDYEVMCKRSLSPRVDLARRYDVSALKMRDLLHTCRVKGFLGPVGPGVAGGAATQKAHDELEEDS